VGKGYLIQELISTIVECIYKGYNTFGCEFFDKIYENDLKIELEKLGLIVEWQL